MFFSVHILLCSELCTSIKDYFNIHVKITCKSAFFRIHSIAKIRRYLSRSTTETIVHAYITSRLDYCNALLYGLPKYLINRLQLLQNSAARLVTLARRREHITPILRSLHWLPVHYRIVFKILFLTYKALNGLAPDYIKDLLKYNDSRRTLRSSNNRLLDEPRANLKTYGERAFSVAAPRLWNKLPLQIRLSSSEAVFKTNLKTYLFKRAFDL